MIRIKVFAPVENPVIPCWRNLCHVANWMERETYDFSESNSRHPNLKDSQYGWDDWFSFAARVSTGRSFQTRQSRLSIWKIGMRTNKEYIADFHNPDMPDIPFITLNLGPTHPATHGIFQNVLKMDGERIVDAEQTVGYIHRAFEKIADCRPLYQITPLTDRLNYCSAPINNTGWHLAVEKLLGIQGTKARGLYARDDYGACENFGSSDMQ